MTARAKASALAFLLPLVLLAGAFGSEYLGGLHPCEMCYWQRWPHEIAVMLAVLAFAARKGSAENLFLFLAALSIIASGLIGAFHAGVEYGWWEGLTQCSKLPGAVSGNIILDIMSTPLVRCDTAQWTLASISLAGFNAIFSVAGGLTILVWLKKANA